MKVLKFGGSSVATGERISHVIDIILQSERVEKLAVVVSAFQGVTDQLIEMSDLASRADRSYRKRFDLLKQRHLETALALLSEARNSSTISTLEFIFEELKEVVDGVFLVRELTERTLDFVMSFGERCSAYIISEAIRSRGRKAEYLDSRMVIKTDRNFGAARVDSA